jgi:hypothetical protein
VAIACKWMQRDGGAILPEETLLRYHLGSVGVVPLFETSSNEKSALFVSDGDVAQKEYFSQSANVGPHHGINS